LLLASFGLGSFGLSIWLARYRWVFLLLTFVLLGFAYYRAYRDRRDGKGGPPVLWPLHAVAALSVGMIAYHLLTTP
jgi:hypothetical protein